MRIVVTCVLLVACVQAAHLNKRQATDDTEDRDCVCAGTIEKSWTVWDPCSAPCKQRENPTQSRRLKCDRGTDIITCKTQTASCNLMPCDDGMDWGPFNECSVDCGVGARRRYSRMAPTVFQEIKCHTQSCDPVSDCGNADLIFVLDSSNSLSIVNWFRTKQFVIDMIKGLNIGADTIRVAVISFSTEVRLAFGLDASYDVADLEARITAIPFMAGVTNTADGLRLMRNTFKQTGRKDARKIAVVLTDGVSNVFEATTIPNARAAQDEDVLIFSIGVGNNINMDELRGISSEPSSQYTFQVNDYESLETITNAAIEGTCEAAATMECTDWSDYTECSVPCGGGGVQTRSRVCTITDNTGSVSHTVTEDRTCGEGPCDSCAYCEYRDGIGYIPDKDDCRRFFICEKQPDGSYKRHHQCCAASLFWDQSILSCQGQHQPGTCTLLRRSVCDDVVTDTPPVSTCQFTAIPNDDKHFMFGGHKMPCGAGTVFSATACGCVHGDNEAKDCVSDPMLHFTFDDHLNDVSCKKAVSDNKGNVHLRWGVGNMAAYFDGSSRLDVQYMNNWFAGKNVEHFSVALWFKRESGVGLAGLVNNGDCDAPSFEVEILDSGLEVSGSLETNSLTVVNKQLAGFTISLNTWYHAALVYDGNNLDFYLDGVKKTNNVQLAGSIENRQCPMQVGHHGAGNDGYFHGFIDDLRVYERTLSAAEVKQLYDNGA